MKKKKLQHHATLLKWDEMNENSYWSEFKWEVKEEKSKMPSWVNWEKIDYLRDFEAPNRDELRTESDERDRIFPMSPNSVGIKRNFAHNFLMRKETSLATKPA